LKKCKCVFVFFLQSPTGEAENGGDAEIFLSVQNLLPWEILTEFMGFLMILKEKFKKFTYLLLTFLRKALN